MQNGSNLTIGYDVCTLLSLIYSNMDISHAILEFKVCLGTEQVNLNFISNLASFEII